MKKTADKKINDREIRQLVTERLKTISTGKRISLGSEGSYSKSELIDHVAKKDYIGKKIMEIELDYLQSLKTGVLVEE